VSFDAVSAMMARVRVENLAIIRQLTETHRHRVTLAAREASRRYCSGNNHDEMQYFEFLSFYLVPCEMNLTCVLGTYMISMANL
jgi:hypothetical protein